MSILKKKKRKKIRLPNDLGQIEFLREHEQILEILIDYSQEKSLNGYIQKSYCDSNAGGFNWGSSKEGSEFWQQVLNGNVEHFYKRYPKK